MCRSDQSNYLPRTPRPNRSRDCRHFPVLFSPGLGHTKFPYFHDFWPFFSVVKCHFRTLQFCKIHKCQNSTRCLASQELLFFSKKKETLLVCQSEKRNPQENKLQFAIEWFGFRNPHSPNVITSQDTTAHYILSLHLVFSELLLFPSDHSINVCVLRQVKPASLYLSTKVTPSFSSACYCSHENCLWRICSQSLGKSHPSHPVLFVTSSKTSVEHTVKQMADSWVYLLHNSKNIFSLRRLWRPIAFISDVLTDITQMIQNT